jgi:hypothetical protein
MLPSHPYIVIAEILVHKLANSINIHQLPVKQILPGHGLGQAQTLHYYYINIALLFLMDQVKLCFNIWNVHEIIAQILRICLTGN